MLLRATIIKKPRRFVVCDTCNRLISGVHLYMYGAADIGDKPHGVRIHLTCSEWKDKKILAAYEKAGLTPHWLTEVVK